MHLTTITLTPQERAWMLDLLASAVENDDVDRDPETDGPAGPEVEWARSLADRLSGEVDATAGLSTNILSAMDRKLQLSLLDRRLSDAEKMELHKINVLLGSHEE